MEEHFAAEGTQCKKRSCPEPSNAATQLYKDIESLCQQLVEASNMVKGKFLLKHDPLREVDGDVVADLICMGADEDRLRVLLMQEEIETAEG